ncbi:hypothetical protein [Rodentibacter myodis]|uniref:Competence protein ComD n=1 Tax=Rodentibacter myodis TaxID=1907939 RepID=A0A1V3JKY6_9PAST|nr:hypothetical protein [Rodentibacter myodis]OOF57441.1 hypothetical protein BKL49_09060 [Rodentibacter myodis]
MHRFCVWLGCLFVCCTTTAADPFDRSQRQAAENARPQTTSQPTKCMFNESLLAAESTFEQLKLVGVVLYKKEPEALFLNNAQKLVIAKLGERLGAEGHLLRQIRKDGLSLAYSKPGQCEQTENVEMKF